MIRYLAGFILGSVASWFWFCKLNPHREFGQLLHREIDRGASQEWARQLENRMKDLEQLSRRLEEIISVDSERTAGTAKANKRSRPENHRGQVIRLWEGGCSPEEITRTTGLAVGEVKLILSLKDHQCKKR